MLFSLNTLFFQYYTLFYFCFKKIEWKIKCLPLFIINPIRTSIIEEKHIIGRKCCYYTIVCPLLDLSLGPEKFDQVIKCAMRNISNEVEFLNTYLQIIYFLNIFSFNRENNMSNMMKPLPCRYSHTISGKDSFSFKFV